MNMLTAERQDLTKEKDGRAPSCTNKLCMSYTVMKANKALPG